MSDSRPGSRNMLRSAGRPGCGEGNGIYGSRTGFRGPGIGRWQHVFQPERLAFVGDSHRIISERPQPLLAKEIDDAIAGDLHQNAASKERLLFTNLNKL
jgi:hypothetical protein